MSGGSRTAFQLWSALEHKGKQSVISAIAVDDTAQHIYLGTSDGQLEEHRIHSSYQNVKISLGARKHIGKKVIAYIDLPGQDSLRLMEDLNPLFHPELPYSLANARNVSSMGVHCSL